MSLGPPVTRRPSHASAAGTIRSVAMACIVVFLLLAIPAVALARNEIEVISRYSLSPRLLDYTLRTPALADTTHVRVLLPAGYGGGGQRRYPVLYLLNGCCENWRSWTDHGDAERMTAPYGALVVMPEGGPDGNYTDWFNGGAGGRPMWETFHVAQLIPWVEETFRVRRGRAGRAIAGLSMGGFGALSYAARHPDTFVTAASFSGVIDTNTPLGEQAVQEESIQSGNPPDRQFGPRVTQEVRWRAHNPWDLAENLRGLRLWLTTGNGMPGGPFGGGPDLVEDLVHRENLAVHSRLLQLGIAHVWDDYGPGSHDWPYFASDLERALPWIMAGFDDPPAPPVRVDLRSAEAQYGGYGWSLVLARPAMEFSALRDADRGGFTLSGSGSAVVRTPAFFRPRSRMLVTVDNAGGAAATVRRADRHGRLSIALALGPDNSAQQYTPGARTSVYQAHVALRRASR